MRQQSVREVLIQLRKDHGYTQGALAEMLGVSYQAVSKWERGENLPDAYTLVDIARIYNVTVDEILSGKLIVKEDEERIDKRRQLLLVLGVMIIIMSPISIFFFDINNYTVYVPILLVTIAIGVGVLIYAKVSSQQLRIMEEKSRSVRKKEEMVYAICAGIFMILGLVFNLFHIAWVVFIFGYAVTLSFKD